MAQGLGGRRPINPHIARLAKAMKARGAGSLSEGAANATGAPPAPHKPGFHPLAVLKNFEPGKPLTGKDMAQAARALTVLETRPVIHGYKGIIREEEKAKAAEAAGLGRLGERTSGNVSSTYKNIAASEAETLARQSALGKQLTTGAANIAHTGNQELAGMQTGALGDYENQLQMRGAPQGGGAQEALAQAVASQQATENTDNQAAQQFAASQAANNGSLAAAMAASAQMQGGAAVGGINRDIINRTGEANQKADQSISGAREKLGEAKAAYGPAFTKNLLGLRGNEQKFILGKAAVAGEKAKLGLEGEKLTAEQEQNAIQNKLNQQKANASSTSAQASLINAQVNKWEAEHPNASSSAAGKKRQEVKQEVREVRSMLPSLVAEAGAPPWAAKSGNKPVPLNKAINLFVGHANSKVSADPALVKRVIEHWVKKHYAKVSKDPNGNSLGR